MTRTERRENAAKNELLLREVNNRIDELNSRLGGTSEQLYIGECEDESCAELIAVPSDEFHKVGRPQASSLSFPATNGRTSTRSWTDTRTGSSFAGSVNA
jgi:hypothetical protein